MSTSITRTTIVFFFLVFAKCSCQSDCSFCNKPPVKFLNVDSAANRYVASESQYRLSLTNGHDEEADPTEGESLNGFPSMKLLLDPDGQADYQLPVTKEEIFFRIQPARKSNGDYDDYCDKAETSVKLHLESDPDNAKSFNCFSNPDDCTSSLCESYIGALTQPIPEETSNNVMVTLQNVADKETSAIWELNLSAFNESSKLLGSFGEDARNRFQETQNIPEFNKQQTIVSIVGKRGVGKSTIGSLLSGNDTMFEVGSDSVGTTTKGANISPTIPSKDYVSVISEKLKRDITVQNETLPFFLIDSEGMGIRGDQFDFVTTSPPAVIAKVIAWVGSEALHTVDILNDINHYLEGLDLIILDESDKHKDDIVPCSAPQYGHFLILINKMMGTDTDEELLTELMTPEPDTDEDALERNKIREKLRSCFLSIDLHGFPYLQLDEGEDFGYPVLDDRFRDGLAATVETILEASHTPKTLVLAGLEMEFNATNAEVIIDTVIDEANKGQLDLTGCPAFWNLLTKEVNSSLELAREYLKESNSKCTLQNNAYHCSECVCLFRNALVNQTVNKAMDKLEAAAGYAPVNGCEEGIEGETSQIISNLIEPFQKEEHCESSTLISRSRSNANDICDISELLDTITKPNEDVTLSCSQLYLCKNIDTSGLTIKFDSESLYVDPSARINILPPSKAENGQDGQENGAQGENGQHGERGANLTINTSQLVQSSATQIIINAYGGEGGDGGRGAAGVDGKDGDPGENGNPGKSGANGANGEDKTLNCDVLEDEDPSNAEQVCVMGEVTSSYTDGEYHCWCNLWADTYHELYRHISHPMVIGGPGLDGEDGGNGENGQPGGRGGDGQKGGQGGNGGNGGEGGDVVILGTKDLQAMVQKFGGKGGIGGNGGVGGFKGIGGPGGSGGAGGKGGKGGHGGQGAKHDRIFTAEKEKEEDFSCNALHCHVTGPGDFKYRDYRYVKCTDLTCVECKGPDGSRGVDGMPGEDGPSGDNGSPGEDGEKGSDGSTPQIQRKLVEGMKI